MKLKQSARFGASLVLMLSSLLSIGVPMASAAVQTCLWTGATDLKFSTATNWSNCGASTPKAGDIIAFGQSSSSSTVNLVNDLGVTLGGVRNNQTSNYSSYAINTISLASGAVMDIGAPSSTCYPSFVSLSYGALTDAGDLTINSNINDLSLASTSIGGNVSLINSSYLTMKSGSTVTGAVTVKSPVSQTTATNCTPGGVGGMFNPSFSGFTVNALTVENGASVFLADAAYPLTLGGGSSTMKPSVNFTVNTDSSYAPIATTRTFSGSITLLNDAQFYAPDKVTGNVTGSITGANFALTADPNTTGTINFNPSSNNSKTPTGVQVNPVQTVTVSDDESTKPFTAVTNETLVIDGKVNYVVLYRGSTLKGNGEMSGLYAASGSIVAPGHSPGCITVANGLTLNGTYQVDVGGTDPCTGYDQIKVSAGGVDVTGATLQASPYNGFVPKVGQSYTIISNGGGGAIIGTFAGIAEGGTYTNQGVTYSVTYKGGAGHDVVLTVTAVNASALPKKPNTGFLLVAAHPMVSLVTTVVAAGLLYGASRRMKTARR